MNRLPWLYPGTRYSYSLVSLTKRIFRVKEIDHISTPCIFANTISYCSCIRFLHSSISLTSLLFYRLCQSGLPDFTILTLNRFMSKAQIGLKNDL